MEEWLIQAVTIMAGHIGIEAVAAHSGMLEVFFFLSSLGMAVMSATSVRVAFHLGKGSVAAAKQVAQLAGAVSLGAAALVSVLMLSGRHDIGKVFSDNPDV